MESLLRARGNQVVLQEIVLQLSSPHLAQLGQLLLRELDHLHVVLLLGNESGQIGKAVVLCDINFQDLLELQVFHPLQQLFFLVFFSLLDFLLAFFVGGGLSVGL